MNIWKGPEASLGPLRSKRRVLGTLNYSPCTSAACSVNVSLPTVLGQRWLWWGCCLGPNTSFKTGPGPMTSAGFTVDARDEQGLPHLLFSTPGLASLLSHP